MSEGSVTLLNNPYGQVTFDLFRKEDQAFVDKSLVIKYLDDYGTSKYPVLLRPRRFGKSTFMQMLKCYYDISYKDRYEDLFSGSRIYEEDLPSHNSYHVIDFDFSSVSTGDQDVLLNSFGVALTDGIDDFCLRYPDFAFDYSELNLKDAATLFTEFTKTYRKFAKQQTLYVLIDEYDKFANEVLSKDLNLFLNITSKDGFLKNFYSAIKNQAKNIIAKTFITGVSSVSLDSLTSGFNIARNVTAFDCFNEYAGFTEDELELLIPKLVDVAHLGVNTKEIIARMKPVYDGYCFSRKAEKTVYNSSMCLYYLDEMRQAGEFLNPDEYFDPASDQDGSKLSQLFSLTQKETAEFIIDTYLQGGLFYISKLSENINLNQLKEYSREQLLSMFYYLGYLTIDRENSSPSELALKIPNRFMSKLFARCTINLSFKDNTEFDAPKLNLSALTACNDDISSFAKSCTEFLSRIMNNQVLSHMNEMALNLALFAKLETMSVVNTYVKMQQSVQIPKEGERFPDLVITVNKGHPDECIYIIELKYLKKAEARDKNSERTLKSVIKAASAELTAYKSAIDFKAKKIKAYAMVFAGPDCIYCQQY